MSTDGVVTTCVECVYIRCDWETTLARLRPLLSTTELLAPPTLPELCLLVRTRPGRRGEKEKKTGVSLIIYTGHFNIHPTKDRNAGKEQVGGGGGVGSGG